MKIQLELDEHLYQVIKRMAPEIDLEIALSGLLRAAVITIATHLTEFEAFQGGSKEAKEMLNEELLKLLPKVIEEARLTEPPAVYECDDCHQQFTLPQEDFGEVTCPSCGRKWIKEDLPKLKTK